MDDERKDDSREVRRYMLVVLSSTSILGWI